MTQIHRRLALMAMLASLFAASPVWAWHIDGQVFCDENGNQMIDGGDSPLNGVEVLITALTASPGTTYSATTDSGNGSYNVPLPDHDEDYRVELTGSGLPPGANTIVPAGGSYTIHLQSSADSATANFLVDGCVATPNPSSTPTATATPVPTVTETPGSGATETPVPSNTATPTLTATPTPADTATSTPVAATATPTPVSTAATSTPTGVTATSTPVSATATPTPVSTAATPTPTGVTPTPTVTATPQDPCGNGMIDTGETCEPPGSVVGSCGQLCRLDCTYCGDSVVQSGDGEQCDDGNCFECDPLHPQRPMSSDICNNMCAGMICKDPSKIRLTGDLDLFKSHGVMVPLEGTAIDFGTDLSITLTAGEDVVFETALPAGAVQALTNGAFSYKNGAAKFDGGVSRLKARPTRDGTYKVTVTAYGDVGQAAADMVTHIAVAGREWTVHALWRQTSTGWVFVGPIDSVP